MECHNHSMFLSGVCIGILSSFFIVKCVVPCFQYYYYGKQLSTTSNNNSVNNDERKSLNQKSKQSLNQRDGSFEVLQGALALVNQYTCGDSDATKGEKKVVEFLSPQQVLDQFFSPNDDKGNKKSLSLQMNDDNTNTSSIGSRSQDFIELLQWIQHYSVDTSHTLFFNQLFGTMDPIALAAEVVALSLNTSVYTFETAPMFTMIERHLIHTFGSFVYNSHNDNGQIKTTNDQQEPTEGLCLPGGSLSNLTALHVARYYVLRQYQYKQHGSINTTATSKSLQLKEETVTTYPTNEEEKKQSDDHDDNFNAVNDMNDDSHSGGGVYEVQNRLVAFISKEAHYSFAKSMNIIGFHKDINLVVIPCLENGQMDVIELAKAIRNTVTEQKMIPFFVGVTAGSTVRGSFDDIPSTVQVCRDLQTDLGLCHKIWIHVDGAWGGAAVFSKKYRALLMKDVDKADSFTFNPHKLLGAPQQTTVFITKHKNICMDSNATGAKYLFDKRKVGADYDLGDASYTCGRRTDAIKFWAMWKYYGLHGLEQRVDSKIETLKTLAETIREHPSFLLVDEWPFNINFFYLPRRIRQQLNNQHNGTSEFPLNGKNTKLPADIYEELCKIAVQLKTRLHKAGVMLIPYQPLDGLDADCFRIVLAGKKEFTDEDSKRVIDLMQEYGDDL